MDFNPNYLPFNWRGWWNFGTGALGDMACHILDPFFRILPVDYPSEVECSTTTTWNGFFNEAHNNDSCPASSIIHLKFPRKDGKGDITLTWMDGGLLPKRPEELLPGEPEAKGLLATVIQHEMDHLQGVLFVDHISPLKRNIILRKLAKTKRLAVPTPA